MPLTLHIFAKDARHLWKEIAVTWVLLAWLTRTDSWRSGDMPGSAEGWLNLLLPLAWSYLTAVCVLQDAVPGERQFWLTLPHRRMTLLAAKVLFVLAFIHVPYFLSNALILGARGFNPFHFLPRLAEKEVFLLFALTLPSLAVASVARSAMQFFLFGLAIAAAAIIFTSGGDLTVISFGLNPWQRVDEVRIGLTLVLMALVSATVAWMQYQDRRTLLCRNVGLASLLAVGAFYVWLPPRSSAALESDLLPARLKEPVEFRVTQDDARPKPFSFFGGRGIDIAIPVEISGPDVDFTDLAFEIEAPGGARFKSDERQSANPSLLIHLVFDGFRYLVLKMDRGIYNRIASTRVTLRGHVLVVVHRRGERATAVGRTRIDVPDLGKCFSSNTGGSLFQEDMLRLACESPDELPRTPTVLVDTRTGREWHGGLGIASTRVSYPRNTWLSPMHRRDAFVPLTWQDTTQPGMQWKAPLGILGHYRFDIAPQPVVGKAVVDFELRGIDLSKFVVHPAR